jgi:hypothetical protein
LSSSQLNYDTQPGFRIMGRYDVCPLAVVEFGYTGIFDFASRASFTDPTPNNVSGEGKIYSLFSNFGNETDFPTVTAPGGQGPYTERAVTQSISLESDLQTAEISYRRYWLGWSPRVSGTLLAGFRYTKLNEQFDFASSSNAAVPFNHTQGANNFTANGASSDYNVNADNNLAGAQVGGDIWISLIQGLRFGMEGKAGLYNNHYSLTSRMTASPIDATAVDNNGDPIVNPSLFERHRDDQAAFISEASIDLVADILPSVSLRGGYEVLTISSIVLAGENFNTGSPYNQGPADNGLGDLRVPFVVDNSHAVYSGWHAGIEYIW